MQHEHGCTVPANEMQCANRYKQLRQVNRGETLHRALTEDVLVVWILAAATFLLQESALCERTVASL